jgi:hypothetical protein
MIYKVDDPEYWQHLKVDNLTDEECVGVLNRLSSIYSKWNKG